MLSLASLFLYLCVWCFGSSASEASEQVHYFVASSPCRSIDKKYQLKVADSYKVSKFNNTDVDVYFGNDVTAFAANCGQVKAFMPFFSENSEELLTPKRPTLDAFDIQVLKVCGKWGSDVTRDDVKKLMINNPNVLSDIYHFVEKNIYNKSAPQTLEDFSNSFADIWSNHYAFKHIFCGMPEGSRSGTPYESKVENKLGGMHFVGRYLDMNDNGYAGLSYNCESNASRFPIYTVAVEYVTPTGEIATKCPNGYSYTMGAKDLLLYATKAFKYNNTSKCYYKVNDKSSGDYYMFFVPTDDGNSIVTFYSVLNPNFSEYQECNQK